MNAADLIPVIAAMPAATDAPTIPVTIFSTYSGEPLGKAYDLVDGKPKKRPNVSAFAPLGKVLQIPNMKVLGDLVQGFKGNSYICSGVPINGMTEFSITTKANPKRGAISRSKTDFMLPSGIGFALIDHDRAPQTPEHLHLSMDQLLVTLSRVLSIDTKTLSLLQYPSSSSFIEVVETGVSTELRGHHTLIMLKHAALWPRALDIIYKRLIIAGFGYVFIRGDGRAEIRTVVDKSTASDPSRAIFAGRAQLGAGLRYGKRGPRYSDGQPLDTRTAIPDLSAAEEAAYAATKAALFAEAAPRSVAARTTYKNTTIAKMTARGTAADVAERAFNSADVQRLQEPWVIVLGTGESVTVKDILDEPAKYHGMDCCDPVEPDYDGARTVAKIYTDKAPMISSLAHGGADNGKPTIYVLERGASYFDALPVDTPLSSSPALPSVAPFPGVMRAVVDAVLTSAPKQQPDLAVLAALIGMAAACPGAYSLPSGMRLNLYGIGIAATGAGKDAPRHAAVEVARAAGALNLGRPASGAGLEDELVSDKAILVEIDEIAHLLAAANSGKAPAHQVDLSAMLLKLFSASRGPYKTRSKAKITGVSLSRLIKSPCVNVLGFATPGTLGEAVGEANITDGLLGRALFAFGNADAHARRVYTAFELPKFVNERGAEIAEAVRASVFDDGIKIAINKDADARLEQLTTELDLTARKHTSPYAVSLTIRAIEKLERVTGVLAVWEAPGAPAITLEHVEWARTLVASSDAAVLRFVENHMHGGRVQANAAKVLDLIRRVLSGELKPDRASESVAISEGRASRSLILKRSKLSSSDLDEAARHLEATEQIAVECSRNTSGTLGTFAAATYVLR